MKLPNGKQAFVDVQKLAGYCLSPLHPRGRHKARVFAAILGLTETDAPLLKRAMLAAAIDHDAQPGLHDEFGQRYSLDFVLSGPKGTGVIHTIWIVRRGEDFPRLATCYVLEER